MKSSMYSDISTRTDLIRNILIETRRNIYMYPELSCCEKRTSRLVADKLKALGLDVRENVGGYGVIGLLYGKYAGRTLAWRAEMDAFKSDDTINKPYKSRVDGVKHVCGHDINITVALGIAEILSEMKDELHGIIKFFFQPNEEYCGGALAMIDDGALDNPRPSAMYGLHISEYNFNQLFLCRGTQLFGVDRFIVKVNFHSDEERQRINISERLELLKNSHTKLSENPKRNITELRILETDVENNALVLKCQFRYAKQEYRDVIRIDVDKTLNKFRDEMGLEYELEYYRSTSPVYNDEMETDRAQKILVNYIGNNLLLFEDEFPPFAADDFSHFQNELGGVYFGLGGANKDIGITSRVHSPDFDVDEECIILGVKTMASFLAESLQ